MIQVIFLSSSAVKDRAKIVCGDDSTYVVLSISSWYQAPTFLYNNDFTY